MRTKGSTRAKCQEGRDVRNVYPAAPWKAPVSVRANGDADTLIPKPWSPSGAWAVALVTLAIQYSRAGRVDQAGDLYHRAPTIQEEALGPEHPDVAVILESYALWLWKTGREPEAMAMGARAKAIRDKAAERPSSEPRP